MHNFLSKVLCAGAIALAATAAAQAAPVLVNGDFELGDFSGWTLVQDQGLNMVDSGAQHGGDYSAFFGETGAPASITQSVATEAGHSYIVSFWLSNQGGSMNNIDTHNTFQLLLDGDTVYATSDKSATNYTLYQTYFTAVSAATSVGFKFQHDENFWLLDDVVVAEVPEPSTMLMLLFGLGALALQRRLR